LDFCNKNIQILILKFQIRRKAQFELFDILNQYHFSFEIIVDRIVELLNSSNETDHDQIKGCLYILYGNTSFFLPTKNSWKMMEKLWPAIAVVKQANKVSTQNLIINIQNKIVKSFVTHALIQDTNEMSMQSAVDLWRPLKPSEMEMSNECNRTNVQSYNNLMETLNSMLKRETL
jgi:hypothetical protein